MGESATCVADVGATTSSWDPPTCVASSCGSLTVTNSDADGASTGTTSEAVAVTCDDGYSGSGSATCVADVGATTSSWDLPTCVASSCGSLIVTNSDADGASTGTTSDSVFVTCDDGYSGSESATCVADVGATT